MLHCMQQITLPVEQDKEYINCTIKLCNMTTLTPILKPRFVCQVIVMTENNNLL